MKGMCSNPDTHIERVKIPERDPREIVVKILEITVKGDSSQNTHPERVLYVVCPSIHDTYHQM